MLLKPDKKAHGGVCEVWVYPIANGIISFPDILDFFALSQVILSGGQEWENFVFTKWTARPKEERAIVNGSEVFRFSLSGIAALDTAQRMNYLHTASKKDYILKYKDQNGIMRLVGSPSEPLSIIQRSRDGGAKFADGNFMEISIVGSSKLPFPQYSFE